MYKLQKIGSYLQIKIKVANNVPKVANTHNKVTKSLLKLQIKISVANIFLNLQKSS